MKHFNCIASFRSMKRSLARAFMWACWLAQASVVIHSSSPLLANGQFIDRDDRLRKGSAEFPSSVKRKASSGIRYSVEGRAYGFSERSIRGSKTLKVPSECKFSGNGDFFRRFRTYSEIIEYMDHLAARYPSSARVVGVGTSFEGRAIRALILRGKGRASRSLLVTSGVHGRE